MVVFNLQGRDFNWNTYQKVDDIEAPKTPEEAITMFNNGKKIEVIGAFSRSIANIFSALGMMYSYNYNMNRKGYAVFIPLNN